MILLLLPFDNVQYDWQKTTACAMANKAKIFQHALNSALMLGPLVYAYICKMESSILMSPWLIHPTVVLTRTDKRHHVYTWHNVWRIEITVQYLGWIHMQLVKYDANTSFMSLNPYITRIHWNVWKAALAFPYKFCVLTVFFWINFHNLNFKLTINYIVCFVSDTQCDSWLHCGSRTQYMVCRCAP